MSDPKNPFDLLLDQIRAVVREEIQGALANGKPPEKKDWMKAKELSEIYGLPATWFEERGRAGDIMRSKAGRYVTFKMSDVEAYLEQHCKKEPIVRKKRKKELDIDNASG